MNVLLANTTCKVGGVSTFMLSMRSALAALGHHCSLFFFEHGPMEARIPAGVPVHFGSLADCLTLVDNAGIDVVHANNVDWPTGISAVRHRGAKLVVTAHKVREPAWTYGWSTANCDAFVTVARWIAADLQPFTDLPIQAIANGVDTSRFQPGDALIDGPPIVAWVGRAAAARKRLEVFAALAPRLHAAGMRVWVIDEQGADAFAQYHPAAARSLRDAVDRWEGVPFDQMPRVYRDVAASGGCVVSTASMEGLPLTLLEAQACGCVVIAADVRGVNECVSADAGGVLYAAEASAYAIAGIVVETLADADRMRRRGREAARRVHNSFSLAHMAERYLTIYESAPLRPLPSLPQRTRGRMRLSPLLNWRGYVEQRLAAAYQQYDASHVLLARGERTNARAAARAAAATAPTMFAQPSRLGHLLRLHLPKKDKSIPRHPAEAAEAHYPESRKFYRR